MKLSLRQKKRPNLKQLYLVPENYIRGLGLHFRSTAKAEWNGINGIRRISTKNILLNVGKSLTLLVLVSIVDIKAFTLWSRQVLVPASPLCFFSHIYMGVFVWAYSAEACWLVSGIGLRANHQLTSNKRHIWSMNCHLLYYERYCQRPLRIPNDTAT